ncbi:MAG: hypothetical protein Q8881_04405 [Sweet potato little leaf phytoplasma]|nr:hypothetical protein [Sweet potato little leaf phytoplasma]
MPLITISLKRRPSIVCSDIDIILKSFSNFALVDVSDETAESIPRNFALGDISDETAESILPNFRRILHSGTFPPKRPNFRRISYSDLFPTKWPNFCRISHSWKFPRNGRISVVFRTRDVSDKTAE